jgi:FAD/FMN-containing dehydrogenase
MSALVGELADILGPEHALTDPDTMASYLVDWTGRFGGDAAVVARPGSTAEVVAVIERCGEHGVTIVPQGGNTGLVGGSVPRPAAGQHRPCVVLSLRRLDQLGPVDTAALAVTAGAGVTLTRWRSHARAAGVDTPVDFASRESATVGGAIATNAGGSRVVRFGTMRTQVLGVEAVLADGSLVGSLAGLPKETVGIHWPSLLAGSEGTLGVVTRARLRLVPWYRQTVTAIVATIDLAAAVDLVAALRSGLRSLDAVELVMSEALDLVSSHLDAEPPVSGGDAYLVVECADHDDPTDELARVLAGHPAVIDAAVSGAGPARDHLVRFRDRITESIAAVGVPLKLDVAVPVDCLTALLDGARAIVARDGGALIPFGHLAEGNVHLNVLEPGDVSATTESVLKLATELGGTISAEHGVGLAKTPWLHLARSQAELAAAAAIRAALDPAGMFNPGVLAQVP